MSTSSNKQQKKGKDCMGDAVQEIEKTLQDVDKGGGEGPRS